MNDKNVFDFEKIKQITGHDWDHTIKDDYEDHQFGKMKLHVFKCKKCGQICTKPESEHFGEMDCVNVPDKIISGIPLDKHYEPRDYDKFIKELPNCDEYIIKNIIE